jgi:hypothetical protein
MSDLLMAFRSRDPVRALVATQEAMEIVPGRAVTVLSAVCAARLARDRVETPLAIARARAAARFHGLGTWVLDEIERLESSR